MKILYGVQTTGSGHISRSILVNQALKAQGHQVDTLFSGPAINHQWTLDSFAPFSHKEGFSFVLNEGSIDLLKTVKQLKPFQFYKDVREINLSHYDLVINDFEPISAWAAKRSKVPSIALSNQANYRYKVPQVKGRIPEKIITRYFAPCSINFGLCWHHFDELILPPIIDTANLTFTSQSNPCVLVYLPYQASKTTIELLSQLTSVEFKLFGHFESEFKIANVECQPLNRQRFLQELSQCQGVITNAGFSLLSEALHLGKALLVVPLKGQFEQESNALMLQNLQLAHTCQQLTFDVINQWLASPTIKPQHYPCVATEFSYWISHLDWQSPQAQSALVNQLWNQVKAGHYKRIA